MLFRCSLLTTCSSCEFLATCNSSVSPLEKPAKFRGRDLKQLPVPLKQGGEQENASCGFGCRGRVVSRGGGGTSPSPVSQQMGLQLDTGVHPCCLTVGTSHCPSVTSGSALGGCCQPPPNKVNAFACLIFNFSKNP